MDDRKRTEDALRESERELRQLVDSVPGMIAVADSEGQHEYANKRTLDYSGTTVLGTDVTLQVHRGRIMRKWKRTRSRIG